MTLHVALIIVSAVACYSIGLAVGVRLGRAWARRDATRG